MPTKQPLSAILFANDVARLSAFYVEALGLTLASHHEGWDVLTSAGSQVIIHAIPPHIAADIAIATPAVRREDTAIKLAFAVANIAAARFLASRHGGEVDPVEREWRLEDSVVCDGHDPEGNVFQLREQLP
jgi:predicted enzyme related to lactoylglutathione lyase